MATPFTSSPQLLTPAPGTTIDIVNPPASNVNSPWVTAEASVATAQLLTGFCVNSTSTGVGPLEIDLGIGGAGAERVIATVPVSMGNAGYIALPVAYAVTASTRVAIRMRQCTYLFANQTYSFTLSYLALPVTGTVPFTATTLVTSPSTNSAGALIPQGASGWANGDWTDVVAATLSSVVLAAVGISPVSTTFPFPTISTAMELDVGVGSSGNEVVVTTIRWHTQTSIAGTPRLCALPQLVTGIASSARISCRLRAAAASGFAVRVKVCTYASPLAGTSDISTSSATAWLPSAATSLSLVTPASAWANSPWVTMGALSAVALSQLVVDSSPSDAENEIDIGVGDAGSEEVVGTVRWNSGVNTNKGDDYAHLVLTSPINLTGVAQRVSLRARTANAVSQTFTAALGYLVSPTTVTPVRPQLTYPAAGVSGVTVSGAAIAWTNSAWGQLIAATAADVRLTGVTATYATPGEFIEIDIGIGSSGSETVLTTLRTYGTTQPLLWARLPVPYAVASGVRISVRFRKASLNGSRTFSATYLGPTATPTPPPIPGTTTFTIRRLRRSPHTSDEGERLYHERLQLDIQTGIGVVSGPETVTDPHILLRWSDDGGATWGNERVIGAGKVGQYFRRVQAFRLGESRDRVYEVVVSDPVLPWSIVDAYLNITQGYA